MSTALARRTDPETSHLAAKRAKKHAPTVRACVLTVLTVNGPLTHDELIRAFTRRGVDELDWPHATASSIRTRCHELVDDGLVEVVPDEVGRSANGGKARLWRAVNVH
ncbi:hypothetical protein [Cellulosimicrobium sp. SH8]|uniref:hypothetical protein n=1 Tax=Cellulosimicrobium sp. SH8 TaxID=2952936 RepID=UPI0021F37327|nr:hypothetical protein [Cellulosimicrobium sp. SH8]